MKKLISLISLASLFAVTSVFIACSSDTDTVSVIDSQLVKDGVIADDYEYIDLKEPMTQEVKLQRLYASVDRILSKLRLVDGKLSLSHTSAEELRIDKDYFEEMKRLFEKTTPDVLMTPDGKLKP